MSNSGYACTLTKENLKKAEKELFEKESDRLSAVQALRDWIHQQPHLNFPTDTSTLVRYLRGAKFSQLRAREIIENGLELRNECPAWFRNIDTREEGIQSMISSGYMIPLPKRDSLGRMVIIFRLGELQPKNPLHSLTNEMRSGTVITHWIGQDENVQVTGQVFIFDFTGYTLKHFSRITHENASKSHKAWQDATPGRVKMFHFYNAGSFFDGLMAIMRPLSKKKYLERMYVHSTMESVYKHVPMEVLPEEYLPDDYKGPNAGPIQSIIDNIKQDISKSDFNAQMLEMTSDKYFIDKKKKPTEVPTAHFRKLNVD